MKNIIYIIAITVIFFTACNSDDNQSHTDKIQSKEMQMSNNEMHNHSSMNTSTKQNNETSIQKSALTSEIKDAYLQIKNALVLDNSKAASDAGQKLY